MRHVGLNECDRIVDAEQCCNVMGWGFGETLSHRCKGVKLRL